jgi:hypothetical protein
MVQVPSASIVSAEDAARDPLAQFRDQAEAGIADKVSLNCFA